ncbi:hypothetical protein VIM7927_04395 [Vibrio mangrovi]|nr:hypothetical protein VIM7927_04395 [Vibrio mangrovi]
MAARVAKSLLESDEIDLVLCFSPSLTVADGIRNTFSWQLECPFDGGLGAVGASYTYQSLKFLGDLFWKTISKYRVLAIFDEIHHCSGDGTGRSNVWGEQILARIQGMARYTLALSGTPWRSDSVPIVMAEYTDPEGHIICDYQYGLKQAIDDGVCRAPKIVLVDNEHLTISEGAETKSFSSILELLRQTKTSYQSVLHNNEAMQYLLGLGCAKLTEIRQENPSAGGLVVASSVKHARKIQELLTEQFHQTATLVTYHHDMPLKTIDEFRNSESQWIVSVGMISEGTDIPRLQVCCHLSSVKTELYFRQVLGRILRVNNSQNQQAWLYTFAEENLIGFAERIEQDIPDTCLFTKQFEGSDFYGGDDLKNSSPQNDTSSLFPGRIEDIAWSNSLTESPVDAIGSNPPIFDELRLGRFRQQVISAFS